MSKIASGNIRHAAVVFVLLWLVLAVGTYFFLARPNENRFDFFPRWYGARVALHGSNPYTAQITQQIQMEMFGQTLTPEQDQHRFTYTAPIMWLLLPFWLLPFPIALSMWNGLQLLILFALPIVVGLILAWRIPLRALGLVLLATILFYRYSINAYIIGQFIPFLAACFVAAWWGLRFENRVVTILALVFAMVRPEVVLVPLATLLLFAWFKGERRVVLSWGAIVGALYALTHFWIGAWELDFYRGISAYQEYSAARWAPSFFNNSLLAWLLVALTLVWFAWLILQTRATARAERIGWILSAAILTGLIVLPQTANYALIMALIPFYFLFWLHRRRAVFWIPLLVVLISPWFFSWFEREISKWEQLLIPLALLGLLTHAWFLEKTRVRETWVEAAESARAA
jgi:hypothetical protein